MMIIPIYESSRGKFNIQKTKSSENLQQPSLKNDLPSFGGLAHVGAYPPMWYPEYEFCIVGKGYPNALRGLGKPESCPPWGVKCWL